jgi:hypothetical protein
VIDMKEPYLEVTFRHGRPLAAYYYLPTAGSLSTLAVGDIQSGSRSQRLAGYRWPL